MTEQWRPCLPNPAYQVSDLGRVRSPRGRILRPTPTDRGYPLVDLGRSCRGQYVHTLVATAFHGPRPTPSHEVDHVDWNRLHNAASNLRWLPRRINGVRWANRRDGRNVWETKDSRPEDLTGDYEPMTDAEREQVHADLEAAGWTVDGVDDQASRPVA